MSRLVSRGYSAADASAFVARSSRSHNVRWRASAHKWTEGGGELDLLDDVPLVGGTLTLDASDPVRRRLTLNVGGGAGLTPTTSDDPLVPFGQFVRLFVRIDRDDGTWFPWLKMGEFPIVSYVYERPSEAATVEASDYAQRVDEFLHLINRSYGGMTVTAAIKRCVDDALPDRAYAVHASAKADGGKVQNYVAQSGDGRWSTATAIADKKGVETFFDWNGDLVIRDSITSANDTSPPSVGPDIGTIADPVAILHDGVGGNLIGTTSTLSRDGGCNLVQINLHPAKRKKSDPDNDADKVQHVTAEETDAATRWGDVFGYLPIVQNRNVHQVTAQVRNDYQDRAETTLYRRGGVVRYIDLDAVGVYWLEPDDKVRIVQHGPDRTESHFVQAVTFDLGGRTPVRIRTRQAHTQLVAGVL